MRMNRRNVTCREGVENETHRAKNGARIYKKDRCPFCFEGKQRCDGLPDMEFRVNVRVGFKTVGGGGWS